MLQSSDSCTFNSMLSCGVLSVLQQEWSVGPEDPMWDCVITRAVKFSLDMSVFGFDGFPWKNDKKKIKR